MCVACESYMLVLYDKVTNYFDIITLPLGSVLKVIRDSSPPHDSPSMPYCILLVQSFREQVGLLISGTNWFDNDLPSYDIISEVVEFHV